MRLGSLIGVCDGKILKKEPSILEQLIHLAVGVGVNEQEIRLLTDERRSIHEVDQAEILMSHMQCWRESSKTPNDSYIFISYASEDKIFAHNINAKLLAHSYTTWLDEQNLLPGQNWDTQIKKSIKNAEVILVLVSAKSQNKRGYIQREIKLALDELQKIPDNDIFLIPAMIEKCDIPIKLQSRQAVRLYESDGFDKLVKALDKQLN